MNLTFYDRKGNLTNSGSYVYWKEGSLFGILSADVFSMVSPEIFSFKKNVVFLDFYVPFLEWQLIRTSDLWIASFDDPSMFHFSLWNGDLPIGAKRPIAADRDAYEKLQKQLNAEFFIHLGALLDREGQDYLKGLPIESTDKYTVEGALRTLHQEMTSSLLEDRMEKIKGLKQTLFHEWMEKKDPFLREKELIRERHALEENLSSLVEVIAFIEFPGFSAFHVLTSSSNWEERMSALGQLAKQFSLQIVLIGNPLEKQVQSAIQAME